VRNPNSKEPTTWKWDERVYLVEKKLVKETYVGFQKRETPPTTPYTSREMD
jgi:hypothetical protein